MKKFSFIASIVALGMVALVLPGTASAACPNAITFSQGGYVCPGGYYCYILSPGQNEIDTLQADFWSLTTGDPAVGSGDDDGARTNIQWLERYNPTYPIFMRVSPGLNNWSQSGIDGCIDNQPGPTNQQVMVTAFSDTNAAGDQSYWAVSATTRNPALSPQFNFQNNPVQDIQLVALPAALVVQSRKISATQIEVDVQCPDLSAGFYSDGSVTLGQVIGGCEVFQQQLALASPGPSGPGSRDVGSGWASIGTVASGTTGTVILSGCNATNDFSNYLGIGIGMDSGYTTQFVGGNSPRVDCGPNIADPSPRFKIIDRRGAKPDRIQRR